MYKFNFSKIFNGQKTISEKDLDLKFLEYDKKHILRTVNLNDIPFKEYRIGGKISYAEWAHVIGLFQTLIYEILDRKSNNYILDIGCGTGLLAMSCQNYIEDSGLYIGLDVSKSNIDFCKSHFTNSKLRFHHFDVNNAMYANNQESKYKPWAIESDKMNLVTALSVWTHLNEEDAIFYFKEIFRVLKKGGKALITFFYLDNLYYESLDYRKNKKGQFHNTSQSDWIFDTKAYNSDNWFYPSQLNIPENAIGINKFGLEKLLEHSGLKIVKYYPGNWKEIPGLYFQDIFVFEKP
ncbi:class I SAM-dependent methyltransferase [Aequorivita echinoideorum]|uniref:Methyltransferase domain-containing protein n=1 Tax=Aequorivita echinoideorum TaxID=1549647 RepID=A0ABS5S5H8_9FLAO|nr:class I SAM-dependent methyltransferase [Aequorivita echinoideorum]MBT0608439.1 methyltransferase domain-containing protein [Aequorivita echinoideorum]